MKNGDVLNTPRKYSLRRLGWIFLALAGPGLIAANAGNDAGGVATYASAGAQFGYRTLFFMFVVTIALIVVQEMCVRLGAFTGEGLGSLIREQFSLRLAAFALVLFVIANIGLVVSEFAGIAAALELFHISRYISVPTFALFIWLLVVYLNYRRAEIFFLILSLVFLTYPVAAVLAHPNWSQASSQLVVPHLLFTHGFLFLGVALIGTTITPYMQFYVAAAVPDKGIGPDTYKKERLRTILGSIFANIISVFIIIATAAAITKRQTLTDASQAAKALKPVAGQFASALFGVGLLGASTLAAAIVPLSTSYAVTEALGSERSVGKKFKEAPVFVSLFTIQIVIGASLALIPTNLIRTLVNAQILNGIITPILLIYILILANNKSLLGKSTNNKSFNLVAIICVAIISLLSLAALVISLSGWIHL